VPIFNQYTNRLFDTTCFFLNEKHQIENIDRVDIPVV